VTITSLSPVQPVPIEKIVADLRKSTNRDDVVRCACHGVATVARCGIFLARRREILKGWDGVGISLSRDAVRNLWLPLSSPSMFRNVVISTQHYYGPPGDSAIDVLFQAIIRSHGGELIIRPIRLHQRVIALLCADGVSSHEAACEIIETIADEVVNAFAKLMATK
jgi:hypothetical protein